MKETKVYVDELPESCFECPIMVDGSEGCDFCVCAILEEKAETKNRLKDCPLIDIKTHDRELVKEVCEIIREIGLQYNIEDLSGVFISYKALDQIQKEYEK